VLAMAIVLTVLAWSPTLWRAEVSVELPPIVVSQAPARPAAPLLRAGPFLPTPSDQTLGGADFWSDTPSLLYRYSPLSDRNRPPALVQTGLE
jgi:hypothetical protein